MFVGRAQELTRLRKELSLARPSLVVVYGRRRIGKSALLKEAAKDRPHVLYQATRVTPSLNLEGFKAEIARSLGADPLLDGLGDWLGVLTYLARKAEDRPGLIVVLDEFPYLVEGDQALPSIIQKFWDAVVANEGKLNLVLCGSMIAQMEDLLAERNPLYGRQTLPLEVKALPLRDAAGFFPDYPAEDRILTYAIFGGIPFYLRLCDSSASLEENVTNLLLTDAGALVDEPNVLLQSELRETQRYASILAAIADGCTKLGEIGGRVRDIKDSVSLSPYMKRLERMRLVRAVHSLDASPKSRDTRYFVDDPLVAFWHRFVRPNMSSVMQGFGPEIWRHQVAPRLDEYMGGAFEEICRGYARRHAQESLPSPAQEIGQIWGADYDIDVAGRLLDGSMVYGECKWRRGAIGVDVLATLIERAGRTDYGRGVEDRYFVLYARTDFKTGVQERTKTDGRIVLLTPDTMLAL
ncbi:ATP-binding protein [Microvirga tunisiensis]|uniref:ATP-binding protein n=1 Tax=Microvirga tunisiensis TaxID=2108360 RepID=A0A5N7MKN4_9HYPH|nr:ATP-binding protein [Microvirga tunisiensis]MPR09000.1 ATP-binding protein [Microvirga tunisiensis]MPR27200.1 ATP-binding protein [Microvirga tunisiensis]